MEEVSRRNQTNTYLKTNRLKMIMKRILAIPKIRLYSGTLRILYKSWIILTYLEENLTTLDGNWESTKWKQETYFLCSGECKSEGRRYSRRIHHWKGKGRIVVVLSFNSLFRRRRREIQKGNRQNRSQLPQTTRFSLLYSFDVVSALQESKKCMQTL